MGNSVKHSLKLESVSLGITYYLFTFFIFDSIVLFFYQKLSFLQILFIVNLLWISFFIFKIRSLKNFLFITIPFISLRIFFNEFNSQFTINKNIRGDVEAIFFQQAKNIYEGSYFNSINNYVFEGYPQFLSYIQSIFLGLSSNIETYNFFSFTSHIVFYLTLLFFMELNISNFHKFILLFENTLLKI